MRMTYEKAGVSIEANDRFVTMIKKLVEKTWPKSGKEIGGFGGGGTIPSRAKIITASVDGVGTKTQIASLMGIWDTIGIDAVAMSSVDVYVSGGIPAFLYDYLTIKNLKPDLHIKIIEGLVKGCLLSDCRLVGGETAEHPFNWLPHDFFDIATFCVGFQNPKLVPKINEIRPGMKIYGWLSYGLGSNGYSLVSKVLKLDGRSRARLTEFYQAFGWTLGEELLRPTKIYIKDLEKIRGDKRYRPIIKAHSHITGGGLIGNIPRILPQDCKVMLDRTKWQHPPVFKLIQEKGYISDDEMDRTFNQGLQLITIVSRGKIRHPDCRLVGIVEKRRRKDAQVEFIGEFRE